MSIVRDKDYIWLLNTYGEFCDTIKGASMMPLLRQARDTVHVERVELAHTGKDAFAQAALAPFDVVLFRRPNGAYVLHRIVAQEGNRYLVWGDNCETVEVVDPSQIIGRMTEFWRGDRKRSISCLRYRAYVSFCCRPWQARMRFNRVVHRLHARLAATARR